MQRYKTELTSEQKEMLKPVLKKHFHHQITPEIRRELFTTSCRGEKPKEMDVESFCRVCWTGEEIEGEFLRPWRNRVGTELRNEHNFKGTEKNNQDTSFH